jgi:hypothetical protein
LLDEAEKCEASGKWVTKGLLEECEVSGKRVLPSRLERSSLSGKKALKKYFINSSISDTRLLETEAIKSANGEYCLPVETKVCIWSGRACHPKDIKLCKLTQLPFHFEYLKKKNGVMRFEILSDLLDGTVRSLYTGSHLSGVIEKIMISVKNKNCSIEFSKISPDEKHLAICLINKTLLGMRARQMGFLYSLEEGYIVGRIVEGKRSDNEWSELDLKGKFL